MNTYIKTRRHGQDGYALATVIVLGGVSLAILGSTLTWTSNNAILNERYNQYLSSLAAAEAATEKVLANLSSDYHSGGAALVHSRLSSYPAMVPHSGENALWSNYEFNNGNGSVGQTYIGVESPWGVSPLVSQYQGLQGYAATFRIVSNARQSNSPADITGAVGQDVQLATIPLFQFAIFYNMDLEINPGANMTVRGRVHSNGHLYTQPQKTLRFLGDVTAAGEIIHDKMPLDPSIRSNGTLIYEAEHDGGVNSLNMPIGTESDNSPASVRQIVERPPVGEDPDSQIGKERFYNKADMIVLVYDNRVETFGGTDTIGSPSIPWSTAKSFISTNASFFNKREGKTVKATVLDIGKLKDYNNTSNPIKTALGHDISSVYIQDLRTQNSGTQPGIKLVNGQTLPPSGLTVATPQPLYVQGHYNAPSSALGTANTSQTKPAALIADAITILSQGWSDGNSTKSLDSRPAQSTTVNAAILAGIVKTTSASYSGGVENFPRFLEDWNGDTLTYNGSMIVMFESQVATALWRGTGSSIGIYNPPTRNWNFESAPDRGGRRGAGRRRGRGG
jgi:hypothetical protein